MTPETAAKVEAVNAIDLYVNKKYSMHEIALLSGTSSATVYKYLRAKEVQMRARGVPVRPRESNTDVRYRELGLKQLYLGGSCLYKLALYGKMHPESLRKRLVNDGVKIRTDGLHIQLPPSRIAQIEKLASEGMDHTLISNALFMSSHVVWRALYVQRDTTEPESEDVRDARYRDLRLKEMYLDGSTLCGLARYGKMHTDALRIRLVRDGVKIRKTGLRARVSAERIAHIKKLDAEGHTVPQIADALFMSHTVVWRIVYSAQLR